MDAVVQRAGPSPPVLHRRWSGRDELARAAVAHVLDRSRVEVPDRDREARALNMLGIAYQRLGRFDEAVVHHHESLHAYREIGNRIGIASTLGNLGWAHYRDGRHATAIDFPGQALVVAGETGHRRQQAEFLWALGLAQHALGHHDQARTSWRHSISILQEIGSLTAAQADVLHRQPIPHTPEIIQRSI
jgi:tetratricopeptide (TPR) repeat protein